MAFIDTVAERLAVAAFEQAQATDDPDLVEDVSKLIGTTSPTLQEVYETCIRYLRAEARAMEFIQKRVGVVDDGG
jgi:hypothetical protein